MTRPGSILGPPRSSAGGHSGDLANGGGIEEALERAAGLGRGCHVALVLAVDRHYPAPYVLIG